MMHVEHLPHMPVVIITKLKEDNHPWEVWVTVCTNHRKTLRDSLLYDSFPSYLLLSEIP